MNDTIGQLNKINANEVRAAFRSPEMFSELLHGVATKLLQSVNEENSVETIITAFDIRLIADAINSPEVKITNRNLYK